MPDKIPARMHFPYALRVARRGFAIRRLTWTDTWWVWRFGVMLRLEDGQVDRVVTATDYEAEDLLSWDWTTLPAGCESLDQTPDMAELLTVRPYDGLPTSADPLGRKCDLPTKAETMDAADWPTLAPPKVAGRRVQWARPPFPPAPGLPKSDWPVNQWSPRKRPPLPPGVQPPPPEDALTVSMTLDLRDSEGVAADLTGCIDENNPLWNDQGPQAVLIFLHGGTYTLAEGLAATSYDLEIRAQTAISYNGGAWSQVVWTGTSQSPNSGSWGGPFSLPPWLEGTSRIGIALDLDSTYTFTIRARLNGVLQATGTAVITVPPYCGS